MNYWTGQITKSAASQELGEKPVRFWQLTDQAVKGMAAGLLWQPRLRGKRVLNAERAEVLDLKKKISELEKKLWAQQKLIEVLKSLPSGRKLGGDGEAKKAVRSYGAAEAGRGELVKDSSTRQPEAGGGSATS
jgi:hypothetical protein